MKKILVLTSLAALLFCGCNKDDEKGVQVSREYSMRLAHGQNSFLSTDKSPNLDQLNDLLVSEIDKINKKIGDKFTITARGDDETSAYAKCDAEAKAKYEAKRPEIIAAMKAAQTVFNTKKAELSPSFNNEEKTKYYIDNFTYGLVSYLKVIEEAPGYLEEFVFSDKDNKVAFVAGSAEKPM